MGSVRTRLSLLCGLLCLGSALLVLNPRSPLHVKLIRGGVERTSAPESAPAPPPSYATPTTAAVRRVLNGQRPGPLEAEAPSTGSRVRLVIEGLAHGETASYEYRRGDRSARGELTATEVDEVPRAELAHLAGAGEADVPEELFVSAEGYARRAFDLSQVPAGREVVCQLVRGRPLRLEFPRLAGCGGHLSVSLTWQDPAGADAPPGDPPPGLPVTEVRTLENAGHAVFEVAPTPSRPLLAVLSKPVVPAGARPVQIFGAMVSIDAQRTTLCFPDLEVHPVDFVAPEPGRPFELSFTPVAPGPLTRPEGTRSRGWTNSYGFHGDITLRSNAVGALRVHLPPTSTTEAQFLPTGSAPGGRAALPQPGAEEGEAWLPLRPIEITGPGTITLTVDPHR